MVFLDFFSLQQSKAIESSGCVTYIESANIEIAGQNRVDWPAKIVFCCRLQRRVDQSREESQCCVSYSVKLQAYRLQDKAEKTFFYV